MKHLGDITSLSGASVPIVDCIIGGSPCQDLSIAGKRAGLAGERSGLFMEQIRIVKEMREYDLRMRGSVDDVRPRYMVWENVPGAFTSGNPKGADFQAVLEEIIKVKNKGAANVPIPEGGWSNAGLLMGDGFSIAWRVHDAQFWGVPQRRKRISLVADFNGGGAGEILFEPKSLSGNIDECRSEREEIAGHTSSSIGEPNAYTLQIRSGCDGGGKGALIQTEKTGALGTVQDKTLFCKQSVGGGITYSLDEKMGQTYVHEEQANTLAARDFKQPQCINTSK